MALFDLKFNIDADDFKDAKFWCNLLREALGTALWVTVNRLMVPNAGMWSLGLSYLIVQSAVGGSYNALSSFNSFLHGKNTFFDFLFNLIAQILGAMGVMQLFSFLGISGATGAQASNAGLDVATAFSADGWKASFFGGEFFGIFLYTAFVAKAKEHGGIPEGLWGVFLVTVAVMCGANVFFPANAFVGDFALFINPSAWYTVLFQLVASLLAQVVLEYLWN